MPNFFRNDTHPFNSAIQVYILNLLDMGIHPVRVLCMVSRQIHKGRIRLRFRAVTGVLLLILTSCMILGQEITVPINIQALIIRFRFIITRIIRCIQAVVITNCIRAKLLGVESNTSVCTGEILIGRIVGDCFAHRIAFRKYGTLCNRFVTAGTVTIAKGFVDAHKANKATAAQVVVCCRSRDITCSETIGISCAMAGANETAGAPAGSTVIQQL